MAVLDRIKNVLLDPKGAWPMIEQETATPRSIYVPYVVLLAGASALATFIGFSVIGFGGFGAQFRIPLMSGLATMVVGFALSLVMVFVLSLIVDALAPTFGGQKNPVAALKVVAYGSTAGFLGGVFNLVPALSMLGLVAALYSVYLIYLGLPVLMRCSADKAVAYTGVVVVCGIVAMVVTGLVTSALTPMGSGMSLAGGRSAPEEIAIKTPQGEVKIDTRGLEQMAKRMEDAGKQMEAAQKSGDSAAAGQAAAAIMGAMAGGDKPARAPLAASDLKAMLPDSFAGLARKSFEAQSSGAMGFVVSSASAVYGDGDQRVELEITDTGGMAAMMAMASWAQVAQDRENDREIEKVYKRGQRTIHEEFRKDGSRAQMTVLLANGVLVEAKGRSQPPEALRQAIDSLDLQKLEALK